MENIGVEVGQKMRSAIKAKLMELGCYVDDELPDYIMVMVANKRTKSQMNDDLQLFLAAKTSSFVDWLQIVLKKLKEVTVTNPAVYKKVEKRKSDEPAKPDIKIKKEKKDKTKSKKSKKKDSPKQPVIKDLPQMKSLTDDLPIHAHQLTEKRKIVVIQENQNLALAKASNSENVIEDSFDIPLLSEVNLSNENELIEIEKRIKNVKNRLGIVMDSDSEDEDFINLKAEPEELFPNEGTNNSVIDVKEIEKAARKIKLVRSLNPVRETVTSNNESTLQTNQANILVNPENPKRKSVLERLGKRPKGNDEENRKGTKINLTETIREEEEILGNIREMQKSDFFNRNKNEVEKPRESALKRLGVLSKVSVPQKQFDEEEPIKPVPSAVKVKPRIIPPNAKQANKKLLLKAVAEAQRSVAQTPIVGYAVKPDALFTKKYLEKMGSENASKKISNKDKDKIKNILMHANKKERQELNFSSDDDNLEYVPKPVRKNIEKNVDYVPSTKEASDESTEANYSDNASEKQQQFIVTLDGIDSIKKKSTVEREVEKHRKKSPSPIIFGSNRTAVKTKLKVPDKLPVVFPMSLKTKEKCKYWPVCRQGDRCEFVHPTSTCKMFPQCKFGDKCLYIHPTCKFEASCTRKDCPYSHTLKNFNSSPLQLCKYYPNCTNAHCTFYHAKQCKFGKYCKNQGECNFLHTAFTPKKSNLIWRSNKS